MCHWWYCFKFEKNFPGMLKVEVVTRTKEENKSSMLQRRATDKTVDEQATFFFNALKYKLGIASFLVIYTQHYTCLEYLQYHSIAM